MEIPTKATKCPHCQSDVRSWFSKHPIITGVAILFIVSSLIPTFSAPAREEAESEKVNIPAPTSVRKMHLKANVRFTGTQFIISNLDDTDCVNATMEINKGLLSGGYVLDGYTLKAGQTYTVGALQFAKDENRFDPFEIKPKEFYFYCGGSNALDGASWFGRFE